MSITKEDFIQWKENAVTQAFIAYLEQEKSEYTQLNENLASQVLAGNATQEMIALDSLSRSSIVSGINLAVNLDYFEETMFEVAEDE